jgi:hypothetical protein
MTKPTLLERHQARRQTELAQKQAQIEEDFTDMENMLQAMSDPDLSLQMRIEIFKSLEAWPRIVLGLYNAELTIAQRNRREKGDSEHNDEPSDIAYSVVAEALDLGPDRIRDLCRKGRRQINQGEPPQQEITAAEFIRGRSTVLPKDIASEYRERFAKRKQQQLSDLMERFSTGKSL